MISRQQRESALIFGILFALMACVVPVSTCYSQEETHAKTNAERAQELLKDQRYSLDDLLQGNPDAVVIAKQIFALTGDSNTKQRIASILVHISTKDSTYFEYLVTEAEKALSNDMPWPTLYDKDGNKKSKTLDSLNPEFLKWCEKHNVDPADAFHAAYYEIPVPWYHLAAAGDPRTYGLLIKGLRSPNPMIVTCASHGLARLQDPRAIDEIILASYRAPLEARYAIAESLLYFPNEKAQQAADEIIVDKKSLSELKKQIQAKGIKWLFSY